MAENIKKSMVGIFKRDPNKEKKEKTFSDKQMMKAIQKSSNSNRQAYPFLIPWLIGFGILTIYPFFYTIYLSFYNITLAGLGWELEFHGMNNYITALFANIDFVPNMISFITMEITYVPSIIIFSFILAMLLNRDIKFRGGFRTIFFLPVIVLSGTVVEQLMWSGSTTLADFSENIIFKMLMNYNEFFAEAMLALFTNFTLVLWFTGIPIILFINGLQKINRSLFEAAKIDGATTWQILWKITIPIIKPTAMIVTIFTIVQLGMFNLNPVITQIKESMYNYQGGLGLSSAYSLIYTIVVLIFVGIAMLILRTKTDNNDIKLTTTQRQRFEIIRRFREDQKAKIIEEEKAIKLQKKKERDENVALSKKHAEERKVKLLTLSPEEKTIFYKEEKEQRAIKKQQEKEHQIQIKLAAKEEKQKQKQDAEDRKTYILLATLELAGNLEALEEEKAKIEAIKQEKIRLAERAEKLAIMSKEEKALYLAKEKEESAKEKAILKEKKTLEKTALNEEKAKAKEAAKIQKEADKLVKQKAKEQQKQEKIAAKEAYKNRTDAEVIAEKEQKDAAREIKKQERFENRKIKLQQFKMKVKRIFTTKKYFISFITKLTIYVLLITISYVFIYPFFSMLSLAMMSPQDIINVEVDFIPTRFYLGNFFAAIKVMDAGQALFNSMWFSTTLAISQTVVSALTGYAFSRYNFTLKKLLFGLILVSFIIPVPIIFIPRLMMMFSFQSITGIKLFGTIIPQVVMSILGQGVNSAILILIFYNFFKLIPNVLYEAAKIDGASPFRQFWEITIKMSMSTIVVVFLFSFVWNWNESYITNQLISDNMVLLPDQLGIFDSLFDTRSNDVQSVTGGDATPRVSEAYRMAATFMSMLPLFIIYFVAQKQFVEGIEKTGITGE